MARSGGQRASRSGRKRELSQRVRVVDEEALALARNAAVAALEDDVAPQGTVGAGGDSTSDDEFRLDEDAAPRRRKRTRRAAASGSRGSAKGRNGGIARHNMPLAGMLAEEMGMPRPQGMVSYEDIAGGKSLRPKRQLCSVCGYRAPYTCTRCAVRFCSVQCGDVHEETRCLKFTM